MNALLACGAVLPDNPFLLILLVLYVAGYEVTTKLWPVLAFGLFGTVAAGCAVSARTRTRRATNASQFST